jgi:hypothetical protein
MFRRRNTFDMLRATHQPNTSLLPSFPTFANEGTPQ